MTAPSTEQTLRVDVGPLLDDGNTGPDDVSHYVDQRQHQDVATAMIEGTELVALCGHRWVPWRDPRKLPVCRPCATVLDQMIGGVL